MGNPSTAYQRLLLTQGSNGNMLISLISNTFVVQSVTTSPATTDAQFVGSAAYRDPSAWYHFVVTWDTTDPTSTNRIKVWINGQPMPENN